MSLDIVVWTPMLSSCANVLGTLGPFRASLPPTLDVRIPESPSYEALRPFAERFQPFSGCRDLFAALTLCAAAGFEGEELTRAVNDQLRKDERDQGVPFGRLQGNWLALWEEAVSTYRQLWPEVCPQVERTASRLRDRLEPVGHKVASELAIIVRSHSAMLPSRVWVAIVERWFGMSRASDGVVVLEARPLEELQLLSYTLLHELVHAVASRHRPGSPAYELASEVFADLGAARLNTRVGNTEGEALYAEDREMRWEGWKIGYGVKNVVDASEAYARAREPFHDLLEGRLFYEDAVGHLAKVLIA